MGTIKIEIEANSAQQSEILIAELSEINFDAFEENENQLSAFIKEESFNEEELNNILRPKGISYKRSLIQDTNWNAKWESEFEPIVIEDFVAVRASFHPPIVNVKHEIIITPKMSFGTGHHATTWLMLQQMQHIDLTNKTVLDFGTGTGILAILAKKLGAKKVVAIDNDEWSINNAKENFISNDCADIILHQKDTPEDLGAFDVVMANINLNVITANINALKNISHQLLLSGFLNTDEKLIIKHFSSSGFTHIVTEGKDNWISMLLTKS